MKPDWRDAPSYANYRAMDDDGTWYWYQVKPTYWPNRGLWVVPSGSDYELCYSQSPILASTTLSERPKDTST